MRFALIAATLFLTFEISAQDTLSLTFIGDIMQHGPQITSAYDPVAKKHIYDSTFKYIREEMSAADLTIANLEFTFGGAPFTGYPMFSAPDQMADALRNAGIDVLVTANNHTCDRRKKGVVRTLDVLDTAKLLHTGSFRNQAEKDTLNPLILEKNGFRLALLNYTYGTNGMPIEEPTRVNLLDEDSVKSDLKKALDSAVDKVIVFVHWGSEYTHKPNQTQKDWAKIFFDNGADIIIGAHPHVVQPMIYQPADSNSRETFLAYSLGNFVSNQRTAPRDGGAMVNLRLVKDSVSTRIDRADYQLTWVWLPTQGGKRRYYIMPASAYEEDRQEMDQWSQNKMKAYVKTARGVFDENNQSVPESRFVENKWTIITKTKKE